MMATATKTPLKKRVHTLQTFLGLFCLVKCWRILRELNFKGFYQSSGKEKEGLVSTKHEIEQFHCIIVQ